MRATIPPPVVAGLIALGVWGVGKLAPATLLSFPGQTPLALAIGLLGFAIDMTAVGSFFRNKTTITPLKPEKASALVTEGLYRISRNPMYLGMAMILTALSVWFGQPLGIIGVVLFVVLINELQIKPEEAALSALFGEEYDAYRARVRRWI